MIGDYTFKEVWTLLKKHGWKSRKKNRVDSSYDYYCGSFSLTTPQLMPWANENNILTNVELLKKVSRDHCGTKRKRGDDDDRQEKVSVLRLYCCTETIVCMWCRKHCARMPKQKRYRLKARKSQV
jgi:hypothetical protein